MIIEKHNRSSLHEGRQYGLGYAILKKVNSNYETCNAFTACKDYLNDLVYIENTGLEINKRVHGFKHNYTGMFQKKLYFNLGICAINYKSSSKWSKFDEAKKLLFSNKEFITYHINQLEDYLNLGKKRTSIVSEEDIQDTDNKVLIFKTPTYWFKNPVLLSLYTLYIRCIFHIDKKMSLEEILNDDFNPFISDDIYLKKSLNKILTIKHLKYYFRLYKYDLTITNLSNIHNYGIVAWIKKTLAYTNGIENIKRCW